MLSSYVFRFWYPFRGTRHFSYKQFNVINKYDIIASYNPYIVSKDKEKLINTISDRNVSSIQISISPATIEKNNEILDSVTILPLKIMLKTILL